MIDIQAQIFAVICDDLSHIGSRLWQTLAQDDLIPVKPFLSVPDHPADHNDHGDDRQQDDPPLAIKRLSVLCPAGRTHFCICRHFRLAIAAQRHFCFLFHDLPLSFHASFTFLMPRE